MVLRLTGIAAAMATVSVLATGAAMAQTGWAVDALLRDAANPPSVRSIDRTTRPEKRYAIVIGNSDYEAIPDLPNAHADANVMTQFLRAQGYLVQHHKDITKRGFENVLRRALFDVDKDTEVVIFFAGHGFQIGAENYLVPVDADLDSVYDVPFEAVSLGSLVGIVGSRARLQIVILDSCRDNPFAGKEVLTAVGSELRETRTGFSSQSAPLNSSLIFSTSPGAVAFDGQGENSPFTAALIEEASAQPDAPVKDIFEGVRRLVYEKTNGRQVPWDSSTLVEPASFGIGAALSRPIAVQVAGGGVSRGLARVSPVTPSASGETAQAVAETSSVLEAPFIDEVEIGFALRNALDLTPADQITIVTGPETGRLVLPDENGLNRDVSGQTLSSADIDRLLLINESVQIPALSLANGYIEDAVALQVNGTDQRIALHLEPEQCDFHAGDHLDPDGMGITRYANELEPEAALAACRAAVEREPENGRFHFQLGRAHVALRQMDQAIASFERARDLGHARAWNALGNAILNLERETGGQVNPQASTDVLTLFARGVDEADPYAMYSLGRQFMRFGGTPEVEIEGYDLMMRSLEVGHTFAMNELGFFYLDEDGEYFDPERGLRYLQESAAREDIFGFNNMGLVFLNGLGGTEVDDAAAFDMFTKAAQGGHPNAPGNLGRMYREGRVGGVPDFAKSVEWYLAGLNRGDARAGGTAAFLIATEGVDGFDLFDAAMIGAQSAALTNQAAAAQSLQLLGNFPENALNGGAQKLINLLGGEVTADGAFGPASQTAMDQVLASYGAGPAETDPVARIVQLASVFWTTSPFRVDLY
ncbi:MAG: caspase family protein [Pseudomonadota bacterium]